MRGEAGPARQGERAPGIVTSVESSRVDDAPTLSNTQTATRNLSRWVWLILVSVFWRESVPWGVELRSCIVSEKVEMRSRARGLLTEWFISNQLNRVYHQFGLLTKGHVVGCKSVLKSRRTRDDAGETQIAATMTSGKTSSPLVTRDISSLSA